MKILIAEKSELVQKSISNICRDLGYETVLAYTGKQAIELYAKEKIDLILIDVELSDINGYEVTKKIKKIDLEKHTEIWIPIIFLSSSMNDEDVAKGIKSGGDDYLTKPITKGILIAKIKAMERIYNIQQKLILQSKEIKKSNEQLLISNKMLEELSMKDSLTKIPNRRAFEEDLRKRFSLALQNNSTLSIYMIEIDYFKLYNDHFGHTYGDECLKKVARALDKIIGKSADIVARYGGEEFVALTTETSFKDSIALGESFRNNIECLKIEHAPTCKHKFVTISVGFVRVENVKGLLVTDIIAQADKALYMSKEKGRNCVSHFEKTT